LAEKTSRPCQAPTAAPNRLEVTLKTQGEIEAAICEDIRRFKQEFVGRGRKDIHFYLIDDLVVLRLERVLTAAE